MISAIAEAGLQQAVRPQQSAADQAEVTIVREKERVQQERPVEKSEDSQRSALDMEHGEKATTTSRNRIEDGKVVVERYDDRGQLVRLSPPGYLPLSETI